ncbi:GNAT family N-acetyltransferase [Natrarchaeobius halalkaliphilus]|uniref:GNAT family N-acetyltransferase n=1 Tax=Natrarchaeobius halalkaliphilus TaxID=1679091 RepID=A0A3N6MC37_9EURY|nr:GNAT family N-acetyltransferase [Natrarchaeobius halalkaliphilus]RQG91256.1 GNAT family N-acetyltransferase [Natrarchaeobius halalkaliphilus]
MATDHSLSEEGSTSADRHGRDERERTDETRPPTAERTDDGYVIRPYEPGDRDDFLDLYDMVLGERNEEWFRWKYEENPYVDHVPMIVATHGGDLVGTKPCFALELRIDSRTYLGFQPADVMVHPDHRRRGLYSRTTERLKEHYRDREPALFFNFPNEATLSGSLKHGWRIVEEVPTFYRVQRPDALIDREDRLSRLSSAAHPVASAYLRACELLVDRPANVVVHRFDGLPTEQLLELYDRGVPGTIHANRTEPFYEWRFENPHWSYDAYVATRDGEPIAGVVVGTTLDDGSTITCLTDVVPLATTPGRRDGLQAILDRVVADHREADLLATSGRAIPAPLLRRFGFLSDASLPLSRITLPTTQVTYPIATEGGHEWTVGARAVTDPANWTITFAEQDTW